jgi:acyl dehydratase
MTMYLEDFVVGQVYELGSVEVTEDEIIEFAMRFDPQPFHVDVEAAKESMFGGLIASGWHTCSLFMRLMVDGFIKDAASLGSPGMDEIRWLAPVRPGDRLTGTITVEDVQVSTSKPERGTIYIRSEMTNQDGVVAMRMLGRGMYLRRPS